jgi:hypothetical protein
LPCGWRQYAADDLAGSQNGRVMSHDRSYHPQIYWIDPELSPRMHGVVKQSLPVARAAKPRQRKAPAAKI